jgi:hypothetical protein
MRKPNYTPGEWNLRIADAAVTSDYQEGYRQAMKHAIEVCESYGYAIDGGGNRYVYDRGAVTCARLLEKSTDLALKGLNND